MRGSVYKRCACGTDRWNRCSHPWTFHFSVIRGGKRRAIKRGGFPTKGAALDAMRAAMSAWSTPDHAEPSKRTLDDFLTNDWLPQQRSKKPTTVALYRFMVERHIVPALGHLPLQQVTAGDVATLYSKMRTSGRLDGKGGLSERTVKQAHAALHRAFDYAVKARYVDRNPVALLDDDARPKLRRAEMRTWSADELRTFLASVADEYPWSALFTLTAMTGLRRSEVLGLAWGDVDLEQGRIAVRRGLTVADNVLALSEPKTGRGRVVDIDGGTIAVLRSHRKAQLTQRIRVSEAWSGYGGLDLVFANGAGEPLHPVSVSQTFDRRVRRSGLPRITFHELRHTHASLLLRAGEHVKVVQERLGHSSALQTLDTYSHVAPGMQRDAADRLGGAVYGADG